MSDHAATDGSKRIRPKKVGVDLVKDAVRANRLATKDAHDRAK